MNLIEQIRGQIGDLVFKRYGEGVVVARKADLTGQAPTEAQAAAREQFRQAALYGKLVMADPATKIIYDQAAKAKGQPVFSLTIADFFNAPSVDEVDLSAYAGRVGDTIVARAQDDFDVTAVKVAISQADGTAVEEGAATQTPPNSGRWLYTATATVPTGTSVRITVTATDRPGHAGSKTETK